MDVGNKRRAAVASSVERVREIEQTQGTTREALDAIRGVLLELADDLALFPLEDFPLDPEDDGSVIYRLSEDADHRFALYASVGSTGKDVPPHNHTTWAVIVGLHGDETNTLYRRTDDGSVAGEGSVGETEEIVVRHGNGVALMPEDIHSIRAVGDPRSVHLHMYGLALEQLHERVMFNREHGTYAVFPATQNIKPMPA